MRLARLRDTAILRPRYLSSWTPLAALVLALPVAPGTGNAQTEAGAGRTGSACLSWVPGPRGCPTADQITSAVEDILGHAAFSRPPCDIVVMGEVHHPESGGWQAELSFARSSGEPLGERGLHSHAATCSALAAPVSLVIALMVEAGESQSTLQVPVSRPALERATTLSAAFILSSGLLPALAYGAGVDWTVDLGTWTAMLLDGAFFFPEATPAVGQGGELLASVAGAALCPRVFATSAMEGSLCVGARAGIIHGIGLGMPNNTSSTRPYGDAEAHARLALPLLGSMAVFVQLGLAVPWVRPRFVYLDATATAVPVYRPQAAIFFASVGLGLRTGGNNHPRPQ